MMNIDMKNKNADIGTSPSSSPPIVKKSSPAVSVASSSSAGSSSASPRRAKFVEDFDAVMPTSALPTPAVTADSSEALQSPKARKAVKVDKGKAPAWRVEVTSESAPKTSVVKTLQAIVLLGLGYAAAGVALVATTPLVVGGLFVLAIGIIIEETFIKICAWMKTKQDAAATQGVALNLELKSA